MSLSDWEQKAVDLLTEVSILGNLIETRINTDMPFDLDETRMAVLMILARNAPLGMTRAALEWTLDDNVTDVASEIDYTIAQELVAPSQDPNKADLFITDKGQKRLSLAIQALLPKFVPGLESVSAEDLASARDSLAEIRRTLDNLPPS
jgi:DNA-binding MarR family transcriptional regulator